MSWHQGPIYIVTPSHTPSWLNLSHPRIHIVVQDSLIPDPNDRPTFNSNALEQQLWRIPNLTDVFVHMNDDYFFGKDVMPWHLFTVDGGCRFFFEKNVIHGGRVQSQKYFQEKIRIWLSSVYHTKATLDEAYGYHTRYYLKHAPFVYRRESLRRMQARWPDLFKSTAAQRFRHWFDLLTPFMHHYYVIEEGSKCCGDTYEIASPGEMLKETGFVIINDDTTPDDQNLLRIQTLHPRFFTINDNFNNLEKARQIKNLLDNLFPNKSQFEL